MDQPQNHAGQAIKVPLMALAHYTVTGLSQVGVMRSLGDEFVSVEELANTCGIKNTDLFQAMLWGGISVGVFEQDDTGAVRLGGNFEQAVMKLRWADDAFDRLMVLQGSGKLNNLTSPQPKEDFAEFVSSDGAKFLLALGVLQIDNAGVVIDKEFASMFQPGQKSILDLCVYFHTIRKPRWMKFSDYLCGEQIKPWDYTANQWPVVMAGISAVTNPVAARFPSGNYYGEEDARIVDLGAGAGMFLHMLKQEYPNLHVTAVDVPAVAGMIKLPTIDEVVPMDILDNTSTLPRGDISMLNNVIHTMSNEECVSLFRRVESNELYIVDFLLSEDNLPAMILGTEFITTAGRGGNRTLQEIILMLEQAGWRLQSSNSIVGTPAHTIVAVRNK